MIVRVLTTCHTQYTLDNSICIFLFNRTTLPVFVTYLTGALYVHTLWFYKHQHDNRVRSKLSVACQRWWFQWRFWFVPSVLGYLQEEEGHKPVPWRNPIERNHMGLHLENEVVKTPTFISNNPVHREPSGWILPILTWYRMSFSLAFFPQLQLWRNHWLLSVYIVCNGTGEYARVKIMSQYSRCVYSITPPQLTPAVLCLSWIHLSVRFIVWVECNPIWWWQILISQDARYTKCSTICI